MKVLHLTTHLNTGGITTYILKLLKPFEKRGIQTYVISSGGDSTDAFKARGGRVFALPIRTKSELNPKIYVCIPKIIELIKSHKIDLIHAHTRVTQVMAFWIQAFYKIPVVTTCHGFYQQRLGRRINPAWGDRVIAISRGVGEDLCKDHKVSSEIIRVVDNGVDIQELDQNYSRQDPATAKIHFGFSPKDPVIGNIARLVPDKGHEYLIRAIALLKIKFSNIRLLIVGDGKYRSQLENQSRALGLKDHIFFTGNLRDVTHALSAMDIFAFPATWREGFGLSIVEAMACRKPVIVTNVWALNELVNDRESGLLVEPKNEEALSEAIELLLNDEALRRKLSLNARMMTEKHFSINRMADEIMKVYQELVTSV